MTQQPFGAAGPGGFDARGAIDLGALAQAREAQAKARERAAAAAQQSGDGVPTSAVVIDVTEATFQAEVVDRSVTVPVVLDFWAEWCGPCKQLSPILEKLAHEYAGRFVLAKIDVDAEQRLGQAFGVQSIPSLFAVVAAQPVPLFQGAVPEPQVRQVLDELLKLAAENGVAGRVAVDGAPDAAADALEPTQPDDPELDAAADAVERGDLDGAEAAYRALEARVPGHPDAQAGLRMLALMRRTAGVDPVAAIARAEASRDDVDALLGAADVLVLQARSADAFALLVDAVRRSAGDDRDRVRTRLLELFDVVGPDDPAVQPARLALANALF